MAKIHNPQDQNGIGLINQTIFDAEVQRATREESRIDAKLDTEIGRSTTEDARLDNKINAETSRATTAENNITSNLNDEIARASAEETRIEGKLDAEVKRSADEDKRLDDKINAETSRATTAENDITSNLNAEISRSTDFDNTLRTDLDNEITRATAKESEIESIALESKGKIEELTGTVNENKTSIDANIETINNNINEIGLDIEGINNDITDIKNTLAEKEEFIQVYIQHPDLTFTEVQELTIDAYQTADDGSITRLDTIDNVTLIFENTKNVFFTSNPVTHSPNIVISGLENNISATLRENSNQNGLILFFKDLMTLKENETHTIIFDAICGNRDYTNAEHAIRLFPITFNIAPKSEEE